MKRDLRNKRILVTGASSGIGRSLAECLASNQARLLLTGRSTRDLDESAANLAQMHGCEVNVCAADLADSNDRHNLVEYTQKKFGELDILINNAGVTSWAHFAESTEEIMRRVMEVNFFAPLELIRLALPLLVRGNQPAIINVSSRCGRRGMPAWPEYSASKFALCGFSEALRAELVRFGVDVLLILPGLTNTGLHKNMLQTAGRASIDFAAGLSSGKVAHRIVRALITNKMETIIGGDTRWLLLVNRFFPRLVDNLLARKVRKLYMDESN